MTAKGAVAVEFWTFLVAVKSLNPCTQILIKRWHKIFSCLKFNFKKIQKMAAPSRDYKSSADSSNSEKTEPTFVIKNVHCVWIVDGVMKVMFEFYDDGGKLKLNLAGIDQIANKSLVQDYLNLVGFVPNIRRTITIDRIDWNSDKFNVMFN